jgi:NAD(P)-dependent dehydrogenase (short-subunit alcohol dehydrogenase family)
MGLLDGRRAVVTGGGSGIGAATCRWFAGEGARVAVLDVDHGAAEAVAGAVGGVAVGADVADATALTAAFDRAAAALGGLDTVVNNAGTGNVLPLHDYPDEEWERLLRVNLTGVFNGTRAAVAHLRAAGRTGAVVNVSSLSGLRPTRGEAPYSAAKAGVVALTMSAALEYGPGIRVNCVSPGFIRTPLTELAAADDATRHERPPRSAGSAPPTTWRPPSPSSARTWLPTSRGPTSWSTAAAPSSTPRSTPCCGGSRGSDAFWPADRAVFRRDLQARTVKRLRSARARRRRRGG